LSLASRVQHTHTHTHTLTHSLNTTVPSNRDNMNFLGGTEATAAQEPGFNPLNDDKKTTTKRMNLFVFLFTFYIFVHIVRGWGVGSWGLSLLSGG